MDPREMKVKTDSDYWRKQYDALAGRIVEYEAARRLTDESYYNPDLVERIREQVDRDLALQIGEALLEAGFIKVTEHVDNCRDQRARIARLNVLTPLMRIDHG